MIQVRRVKRSGVSKTPECNYSLMLRWYPNTVALFNYLTKEEAQKRKEKLQSMYDNWHGDFIIVKTR